MKSTQWSAVEYSETCRVDQDFPKFLDHGPSWLWIWSFLDSILCHINFSSNKRGRVIQNGK